MRFAAGVVLALAVWSLPVAAAEGPSVHRGVPERQGRFWVERDECTVPVRSGGRLVVRAELGSITVLPGATDHVRCEVRLTSYTPSEAEARWSFVRADLMARRIGTDGAFLQLRYPSPNRPLRRLEAAFCIQVPAHFNVDVETRSGPVEIARLDGELRAVTGGGDIRTGDITGPVRLETAAGDIDLGNIGQNLEAHTMGGSVRVGNVKGDAVLETQGGEIVSGMVAGAVHADTAAGDIILRAVSGTVAAHTASGQIELGECGASVRARTGAGSIHVDGARGRVDAETAGGNLDLLRLMSGVKAQTADGHVLAQIDASRETFTASSLESLVGDVQVFVPPDLPLTVRAMILSSAGHVIASDFPLTATHRDLPVRFGLVPAEAAATLAGGGAPLGLRTDLGNIELRKLDSESLARVKAYQQSFWRNWQERTEEQQQSAERMQKAMQEAQQLLQQQLEKAIQASSRP